MKHLLAILLLMTAPAAADPNHIRQLGIQAGRIRNLAYRPIVSREVTQAECSAYVRRELLKDLTPRPTSRREGFLRQLGLLSGPMHLREHYLRFLTSQVRGLYDPHRKIFLVVHGQPGNLAEWGVGLLSSAMGLKTEDVCTVHEMEHAVQDQHFDLQALEHKVPEDFDRELALQSLVEGDATLVMFRYACGVLDSTPWGVESEVAQACRYDMSAAPSPLATLTMPEGTPRFLQEVSAFPYLGGSAFVLALQRRGGWPLVDRAFRRPPRSSAEIFHPELYGLEPDPIHLQHLELGHGWTSLGQDTAGELSIRLFYREHGLDPNTVNGWRGDRYEVFVAPGKRALLWTIHWATAEQARTFREHALSALKGAACRLEGRAVVLILRGLR